MCFLFPTTLHTFTLCFPAGWSIYRSILSLSAIPILILPTYSLRPEKSGREASDEVQKKVDVCAPRWLFCILPPGPRLELTPCNYSRHSSRLHTNSLLESQIAAAPALNRRRSRPVLMPPVYISRRSGGAAPCFFNLFIHGRRRSRSRRRRARQGRGPCRRRKTRPAWIWIRRPRSCSSGEVPDCIAVVHPAASPLRCRG